MCRVIDRSGGIREASWMPMLHGLRLTVVYGVFAYLQSEVFCPKCKAILWKLTVNIGAGSSLYSNILLIKVVSFKKEVSLINDRLF